MQTERKPFSDAISLQNAQLYGKQTKTFFFSAIQLSATCFSQEKAKTLLFSMESSKKLNFVDNYPKDIFSAIKLMQRVFQRKTKWLLFVT